MSQLQENKIRRFIFSCINNCISVLIVLTLDTGWAIADSELRVNKYSAIPSVTAVLRRFSSQSPDVFSEAWISISPNGLRVTDLHTQSELIKDFVSEKVWMIDRRHKIQHEIDVLTFQKKFPELVDYLTGPDTQSNILGLSPCVDWNKSLNGERVWRGQIVEDWNCSEESGVLVSSQLFSNSLGMVVRVEHPDTTIEELQNIKKQVIGLSVFQGEKAFKSVTLDEFFENNNRLAKFSEN